MATALAPKLARLNPCKLDGTALPANLLLMAKLIAVVLLFKRVDVFIPPIFIPFFRFFDLIPYPVFFQNFIVGLYYLSILGILFNVCVRTCCFVLGSTFYLAFFSSVLLFSNNRLYCGSLFILLGLQDSKKNIWMFWIQFALVYLGSGLSKFMIQDWRNGIFMNFWIDQMALPWVKQLRTWLPSNALSLLFSWATIATELGLVAAFLRPRWRKVALSVGILFHSFLFLMTHETFGIFYYVIVISYSCLIPNSEVQAA